MEIFQSEINILEFIIDQIKYHFLNEFAEEQTITKFITIFESIIDHFR